MANNNDDQPTPSSPSFSNPSHITTLYRQNLSTFLFHSDASLENSWDCHAKSLTSWIGDTARSLALRAATPYFSDEATGNVGAQGNEKKRSRKKSNIMNAKASPFDIVRMLPPNWSDFVCMACGTFLFPPEIPTTDTTGGIVTTMPSISEQSDIQVQFSQRAMPSNIYLRPLKRGRTRRRRASRSKAKQLHNHSLSLQRRGAPNANIQLRKDTLIKEEMKRIAFSYRMGDGRAKNCLVMRCTFCGTKKKRKGMEVEKNPKIGGGKLDVVEEHNSVRKRRKDKQPDSKRERKSLASQISDNSDFISLSPIGGVDEKSVTQHTHATKRKQDDFDAFASPLVGGRKKKKKKKPDAMKGDLMDFLSSLND